MRALFDWLKNKSFYEIKRILETTCLMLLICFGILFGAGAMVYYICLDLNVHPAGIFTSILALILCVFSGFLAKKLHPRKDKQRNKIKRTIQYTSLVICAGGLLLAILV